MPACFVLAAVWRSRDFAQGESAGFGTGSFGDIENKKGKKREKQHTIDMVLMRECLPHLDVGQGHTGPLNLLYSCLVLLPAGRKVEANAGKSCMPLNDVPYCPSRTIHPLNLQWTYAQHRSAGLPYNSAKAGRDTTVTVLCVAFSCRWPPIMRRPYPALAHTHWMVRERGGGHALLPPQRFSGGRRGCFQELDIFRGRGRQQLSDMADLAMAQRGASAYLACRMSLTDIVIEVLAGTRGAALT